MNLTAPTAVAALRATFLDLLREGLGDFCSFEDGARSIAMACCARAMSESLEERDHELAAPRAEGVASYLRRHAVEIGGGSRSTFPGALVSSYNQRGRAGSTRAPPPSTASGPTSATRPPAPRWDGDQQKLYADKLYLLQ